MNLSSSFVEGLITIIVTAILIPFIFRVIDDRKAEQQRKIDDLKQRKNKEFEAELSRQSKVIEAQVQFIEKLADLLWEYQLTAIDVSYYYLNLGLSEQYQQMSQNYLDTAGPLLGKIRAEISKSLRLASHDAYQALLDLYYKKLSNLDVNLTLLIGDPEQKKEQQMPISWHSVNNYAVYELSKEVDDIINRLGSEFGLKGNASEIPSTLLPKPIPSSTL